MLTISRTFRASVGYAVTWIMSQRILIHLRGRQDIFFQTLDSAIYVTGTDAAAEHQVRNVVVSQKLNSGRDVSRVMRSQFNGSIHKGRLDDEYDLKGRSISANNMQDDSSENVLTNVDLDIQVQVEQTVTVDYLPAGGYDRDPYTARRNQDPKSYVLPR